MQFTPLPARFPRRRRPSLRYRSIPRLAAPASVVLFCCVCALGVSTSNWTQTSEADWKAGQFDNVVATNLGDLKLSRAVKTVLEEDEHVGSVGALAEGPDGAIYAGSGPEGMLLRVKGDEVTRLGTVGDAISILSLCFDKKGRLLVGTGGEAGKILRYDHPEKEGEKPVEVFKADGVHYIWQIRQTPDGNLYAATGPTGKLFEIKPDGTSRVVLDTDENNLTALTGDGKDLLYVGTDPNGLVYRVNRKTGSSFVLYDASEAEISALILDSDGNLYASTAEAKEEAPQQGEAAGEAGGRPEGGETGVPITQPPPKTPAPPSLPNPNPGRPNPIPKTPAGGSGAVGSPQSRANAGARLEGRSRIASAGPALIWSALAGEVAADAPQPRPARPPRAPAPAPAPSNPATQPTGPNGPGRQPQVEGQQAEPRPEGNAIYRIDPEGFVTEIFRAPVLVLAMAEEHGALLVATGNDGQIFQVDPKAGETAVLAKVDAKDVVSMLPARDGRVYLGLANVGGIAAMSPGYAGKGTYVGPVFDATQISRFGKIHLHGSLEAGTTIEIATRSGNVRDPAGKGWSDWTEPTAAAEFLPVKSPPARFLQYRLTFTSKEGAKTPIVEDINIAYQMPNLPPVVRSIRIAPTANGDANGPPPDSDNGAAAPAPPRIPSMRRQTIAWEASDPNGDPLEYALYFRRGESGQRAPWILLKEHLTDATYDWDTRSVADGRYEVKVVASDAAANVPGKGLTASRVSDPMLVNNTAPSIGDLKKKQDGASVTIALRATDEAGVLAAGDYAVDSNKRWQAFLPSDTIWDSPDETATFTVKGLSPGNHQVTIRVTDASGNAAFQTVLVDVPAQAAAR